MRATKKELYNLADKINTRKELNNLGCRIEVVGRYGYYAVDSMNGRYCLQTGMTARECMYYLQGMHRGING